MAIHIPERSLLAYRFFKKEKECKEEEQDDYKCTQRGGVYYRAMYPLSSLLPLHSFPMIIRYGFFYGFAATVLTQSYIKVNLILKNNLKYIHKF
ncbi:MAG: hypothetical protein ACTHKC_06580 [Candidatus Nitrosocosmicus sp.]